MEKTAIKLKFKKTIMAYTPCYVANNYKVVDYGGKWFAFYAVDITKDKTAYIWGDSCYRKDGVSATYKTAKEAQYACQKHLDTADKAWNYTEELNA